MGQVLHGCATGDYVLYAKASADPEVPDGSGPKPWQLQNLGSLNNSLVYLTRDLSFEQCGRAIVDAYAEIHKRSQAGGNIGMPLTAPISFCKARYFPAVTRSECQSAEANLRLLARLVPKVAKTSFSQEVLHACAAF